MKKSIAIILSIMLVLAITYPAAAISKIAVNSIKLSSNNITLKVGQTSNLEVTLIPANTTEKSLTYTTGNKNIATVDNTGKIKGISNGTTSIAVYTLNKKIFAKCNVTVSAAKDIKPCTIKTSIQANELSNDQIAEFEKNNPNIKVQIVTADSNKLMAMLAAGNPIDVIRIQAFGDIPAYVQRGICAPLDSYINNSQIIKRDDFAAIQGLYQWDGEKRGKGPVYGLDKDWSPDTTLWINKKLFKDAGVEVPSTEKSLTYSQLDTLAKKLSQKSNGKVSVFGLGITLNWQQVGIDLAGLGKSLWSSDFSKANFSSTDVKKILQRYINLQKEGIMPSAAMNPFNDGWGGGDFMNDTIAIFPQGYWYGGMIRGNDKIKDRMTDFVMLPSPTIDGGNTVVSCITGTGGVMYSKTKNPDAAWKFMEYFFGNKGSEARAKGGWGLPAFKSKMSLIPNTTDFDKQISGVALKQAEVCNTSIIKVNPYVSSDAINATMDKFLVPVLYGKDTLDNATKQLDDAVNTLIAEGMEIAGK